MRLLSHWFEDLRTDLTNAVVNLGETNRYRRNRQDIRRLEVMEVRCLLSAAASNWYLADQAGNQTGLVATNDPNVAWLDTSAALHLSNGGKINFHYSVETNGQAGLQPTDAHPLIADAT